MNFDARIERLERTICPECGRPLKPLQEQSGTVETIDISGMSVDEKRSLLAKLHADKYRNGLPPPLTVADFQKLDMPAQLAAIRGDYPEAW